MRYILNSPWIFALFIVSGLIGAIGAYLLFRFIVYLTGADKSKVMDKEWRYTGVWTGIFERAFFTSYISFVDTNGIGQTMMAWIAIKGQVHYKMFTDGGPDKMPSIYLSLLGSLSSLMFVILAEVALRNNISISSIVSYFCE